MATVTTCDGTGVEIPAETPTTGQWGHQYSDAARPIAEAYLDDLSALHTKYAQLMQTELGELRARYREKLQQLPDDV
jgi:hypothetical protein